MKDLYKFIIFSLVCCGAFSNAFSQNYLKYQPDSSLNQHYRDYYKDQSQENDSQKMDRAENMKRNWEANEQDSSDSVDEEYNPRGLSPDIDSVSPGGYQLRNQEYQDDHMNSQMPQMYVQNAVKQALPQTDNEIILRIRERLNNDPYLSESAKRIQITSTDGYVGLRGLVHSTEEKNRIESLTKNIDGVKNVGSNLVIK